MKTKKILTVLLSAVLAAGALTACGSKEVVSKKEETKASETVEAAESAEKTTAAEGAVKTGLSFVTDLSGSKDASAEGDGAAQADMTLVAVAVGDDGVIVDCVIDQIKSKITFSTEGALTTDPATTFASKNVLGDEYGMRKASSIGKEWNEQAAAVADFAKGKTVEELKGVAVDESGMAADADLAASATVYIGNFISGIEEAVNNEEHRGAAAGDVLALTSATDMAKSKDATAEEEGLAQAYASAAVVTTNGDTVTSCYIDAVQANVNFDAAGKITTDLTTVPATKNALGDEYGMKKASTIGKEWNEQMASFCEYVTGKTADEIKGIAVNEETAPTDADLAASVTVKIGSYIELVTAAFN